MLKQKLLLLLWLSSFKPIEYSYRLDFQRAGTGCKYIRENEIISDSAPSIRRGLIVSGDLLEARDAISVVRNAGGAGECVPLFAQAKG